MSNGYKPKLNPGERKGKPGGGFSNPDVAAAVKDGLSQDFMNKVEDFAGKFQASNSQVRNIFTAVKRLQDKGFEHEPFLMLRPRLAYATQRDFKLKPLKEVLSPAVDEVLKADDEDEREKRFNRFCLCCEAILAYARK